MIDPQAERCTVETLSGSKLSFVWDVHYQCVRFYQDERLVGIVPGRTAYDWAQELCVATVMAGSSNEQRKQDYKGEDCVETEAIPPTAGRS